MVEALAVSQLVEWTMRRRVMEIDFIPRMTMAMFSAMIAIIMIIIIIIIIIESRTDVIVIGTVNMAIVVLRQEMMVTVFAMVGRVGALSIVVFSTGMAQAGGGSAKQNASSFVGRQIRQFGPRARYPAADEALFAVAPDRRAQ